MLLYLDYHNYKFGCQSYNLSVMHGVTALGLSMESLPVVVFFIIQKKKMIIQREINFMERCKESEVLFLSYLNIYLYLYHFVHLL